MENDHDSAVRNADHAATSNPSSVCIHRNGAATYSILNRQPHVRRARCQHGTIHELDELSVRSTPGEGSHQSAPRRESNSQRASITSSALFMSVAESMVIFGPIVQVGCLRAFSGEHPQSSADQLPRNGPPLAVRHHTCDIPLPDGPLTLEDRGMLAVHGQQRRPGFGRTAGITSAPATTSVSLFASAKVSAALDRRQQPCNPADPTMAATTRSPGRATALINSRGASTPM